MGHQQYAVQQVLGQSHAIGMVSLGEGLGQLKATGSLALEQLWANSMLLAMPASREAGSIPCYQHCIFRGGLGQLNAIGSPTSERPWAIGSMPFGRCWANPMLLAWSLWVRGWANSKPPVALPWSTSGPIPRYWPCLPQGKLGQSHAIGIVSLEGDWANSMPSVVPLWSDHGPSAVCHSAGAGPIPCYQHGLFG